MRFVARLALYTLLLLQPIPALGETPPSTSNEIGKSSAISASTLEVSPKTGWRDLEFKDRAAPAPWWQQLLLWPVNRALDLWDVFRIDVGVGFAYGGVIRVTEYAQIAYRDIDPISIRVGDFGRDWPLMVESSNEIGISPSIVTSKDRDICSGELGVGADLFIVGAYFGLCLNAVPDFVAGLFFWDLNDDDLS